MLERTKPLSTTFVETHVFTKRIVRLGLEQLCEFRKAIGPFTNPKGRGV